MQDEEEEIEEGVFKLDDGLEIPLDDGINDFGLEDPEDSYS